MTNSKKESEFAKYVKTHSNKQVRELLDEVAELTDPLARELLKRLAE